MLLGWLKQTSKIIVVTLDFQIIFIIINLYVTGQENGWNIVKC